MFHFRRFINRRGYWSIIIGIVVTAGRVFQTSYDVAIREKYSEKSGDTLWIRFKVNVKSAVNDFKSLKNKNKEGFEIEEIEMPDFNDIEELSKDCSSSYAMAGKAHSHITMEEIYANLNFNDSTKYGDWQQNWKIDVNPSRFTDTDKLTVFMVPHAHNDPGWIKTYEEYYEDTVRSILDLMLENLYKNPTMKFIWVEMSFFSLWWDEISEETKLQLINFSRVMITDKVVLTYPTLTLMPRENWKDVLEINTQKCIFRIVERKQLEFVTGGWVMPDEANSHYYSILIQQFEGNQWLKTHLDYIPSNGWSIDPFGLSPTMAYILKRSGFKNMLIQRTHYLVKQYLGNKQQLQFLWTQNWDKSGVTDMMTHMSPFSSYSTASTCGPDQSLCRTFDYREPFQQHYHGQETTASNIEDRSSKLVEQYKKTAMLFKTNKILVPLGTDFGWCTPMEWEDMTRNYGNISRHVNQRSDLQTTMLYGTLDDYFEAIGSDFHSKKINLSKLSGDFFTYASMNQHYWSGYYTSRPFHKALDRKLISYLRSAHLAYTFLNAELSRRYGDLIQFPIMQKFFEYLRNARRTLSLFQHHDGVTGTSKDDVMDNYAEKLTDAIKDCGCVMQKSIQVLTQSKDKNLLEDLKNLDNDKDVSTFEMKFQSIFNEAPVYSSSRLAKTIFLTFSNPQAIVTVFNALAQTRTTLISVTIRIPDEEGTVVRVTDLERHVVDSELFPVFISRSGHTISKNFFQLNFIAKQNPMAINSFVITIVKLKSNELREEKPKIIFIDNQHFKSPIKHPNFEVSFLPDMSFNIDNGLLELNFDSNGFIKTVRLNDKIYPLNVRMFTYGTKSDGIGENSGLYLFLPNGPAHPFTTSRPLIKIVKGRLQSYVEVSLLNIQHKIIIYKHEGMESNAIEITNAIDLKNEVDFELLMRFDSDVRSGNISFTDLNAFQMIGRKRFNTLPIQGHYYPMPSATYIEDSNLRITVLGSQPVGTASLKSGQIDVMMDRTLARDDGYGVGQGSGEAIPNVNIFKLLLETPNCEDKKMSEKAPMLSLRAHLMRNELLHPLQIFLATSTAPISKSVDENLATKISDYHEQRSIPCDIEFLDAIPLAKFPDKLDDIQYIPLPAAAVLIRRIGFDARFNEDSKLQCESTKSSLGRLNLNNIFPNTLQPNVSQMSISFLYEIMKLQSSQDMVLNPMEIYGFQVGFQQLEQETIMKPVNLAKVIVENDL